MSNPPSPFDLTGRVAIITGGNGGIGRSIALGMARSGAAIAVLARNEEKNERVLDELKAIGVAAFVVHLDVNKRDSLAPAVAAAERALGDVDILVNNVGIANPSGGILRESIVNWDSSIETNLSSCFLLSQLAARSMVKRKRGKIINLASMYSFFGSGFAPSYSAAKGAVVQLTKSMAIELAPHNIQVNALAPGWIETDMTAAARSSPMNAAILSRTPANRWGRPDELAGPAVFLASAASDFITGITLPVDGGYSIA